MSMKDIGVLFSLLAGAGLLVGGMYLAGAFAKPPWAVIVKGPDGKDIIKIGDKCYNEVGALVTCPPDATTCPTGQQNVNGVCVPVITNCPTGQQLSNGACVPIVCPTGFHLVGSSCVQDTPTSVNTQIDNFNGPPATYVLGAGQVSPNGLWKGIFTSGGVLQQIVLPGTTNGVMQLEPQAVTSPGATSAPFILGTKDFTNFDATFKMRTIQQLRTGSAPNNWETAWFMWHYTDVTHHYYFTIKMNGAEMGKKDNAPGNTNLEDQLFLATPGFAPLVLGQWYDVHINMVGYHIQVWINGVKLIDFTDTAVHDPSHMSHGFIGLYSEDSRVQFDDVNVVPLP